MFKYMTLYRKNLASGFKANVSEKNILKNKLLKFPMLLSFLKIIVFCPPLYVFFIWSL